MASICNADVARFEEKEMISEVLSPEYNEQQPAGFTNACARASSSQVYETQMQPVLPPSKSQESRDMPKAPARPSDEKVQEFVRQFQQVESRQASSKEALEQISTLVEVTVDMFGTLNGALNQMKTDIGHLHANLSSLETKVSQTPVPSTPPHPAAQVAEKSAGDDVVESLGKEISLEACCGDEPMQSLQLSFTSEPTFAASTTPDSDGQSELTSLDVSKISGKSSTEGPSHPHPNEALVSLINVALKHPDLSGAPLLRQWHFQQQRVKSQRDLNVDLVANKSVLAVQNQQFAALVRVAMHHGSLAGRDLLHQFESELHFEEEKHSETRAGRSSDASISFQKQLSQDSSDEVLRSYGIQPSLCHQRGVVSLVQVALKHPDVNGFPLLQLWKKERVKIKSQRQLNLNCIEKKCEIHLQNRQFVALVYAALFYPNLEGEELLNRFEELQGEACEPNSPIACVNPKTFWSRSTSPSPRPSTSSSPRPSLTTAFDPETQERLVSLVRMVVDHPELSSIQLCELWRSTSRDACSAAPASAGSLRAQSRSRFLGTMGSTLCSPLGFFGSSFREGTGTCKTDETPRA